MKRTFALLSVLAFTASAATKGLQDGEGLAANAGVRVWYRVEGAASAEVPILLIHGGPGATARPFEKTIGPELAKTRPVIYMDYRGAGRSERPKELAKYSFAILASDAEALRLHLGIKRWIVFGHSNGGATAITYAAAHPEQVAGLVLCNPLLSARDLEMNMVHKVVLAPADKYVQARAIYKSKDSTNAKFDALLDLIDRRTRYGFQFFRPENNDVLEGLQGALSKELGKDLMEPALIKGLVASGFFQFDAFASADALTMPVLMLLGKHDAETSVENAMTFALKVNDGYVALLERSGHHPYLEEPAESAKAINSFSRGSRKP